MRIEFNTQRKSIPLPGGEAKRVETVNNFKHLDFDLNAGLQGIVKLAAEICDTPISLITLLDENEQFIKVRKGVDVCRLHRELSFCNHTIKQYQVMVVEDMTIDKRFLGNPFVTDGPKIRFYAGAPLTSPDGHNLGTLCVLDVQPKILGEDKKQMLRILADQALHLMELQRSMELLNKQMADIERQNKALTRIAFIQSHEFRSPVASILGLMNLIKNEGYSNSEEYLVLMEEAVKMLDEKIHMVVATTQMANGAYIA